MATKKTDEPKTDQPEAEITGKEVFFPEYGVTVVADNLEEANEKLQQILAEQKQEEGDSDNE